MKSRRPVASDRRAAKWLSLALVALLSGPFAASARWTPDPPTSRGAATRAASRPAPQSGLVFTVNTTVDAPRASTGTVCDIDLGTAGDQCSLRAAIQAANENAGAETIQFAIPLSAPGCDSATKHCIIALPQALPELSTDMEIRGPGADKLTVRSISDAQFRIFNVTTAGVVTLSGMTISFGRALGGAGGGGIQNFNQGTLNVIGCAVTDNLASYGGGIENRLGTLNVRDSTVARNLAIGAPSYCCADGGGGGISNTFNGTLTIANTTVHGNRAIGANDSGFTGRGLGGGVYTYGGALTITNSTISGNSAEGPGGGLGGGIYNESGITNVRSTIVANNFATASGQDLFGPLTSQGFNLAEDPAASFVNQQPTDRVGVDPKLGPLQNNGGPTQTMALLPGSLAIDKGTSVGLTGALSTDQRGAGYRRTVDDPAIQNAPGSDGADIGAFEVQPSVQFSSAAYSVSEGAGSATITVKRTGGAAAPATVKYATSNVTAAAGKDYAAASGTLSFAAGQTTRTFTVAITGDALDEADEIVGLTLSGPTGDLSLGSPATASLKIIDDDPTPTLSVNNVTLTEGNSGAVNANFTVTLSAASGRTVTVKYATADGTAKNPADYAARAGTLSFLPGQTTKILAVGVRGEVFDEANETFYLNLSAPANAAIADGQGLCTITDDDPLPALTITNATVTEVDSSVNNVTLTVKLSAASGKSVTVNFVTANGTASSANDYVAKSGTLSFAPGQTAKLIVIQVRGDLVKEANETFFVNLNSQVNATLADGQGQVTIINDD